MMKYIEGDLFSSPAQVIVNTVNTVGVMGKGIALEFKRRYPEMFEKYKKVCENASKDLYVTWDKAVEKALRDYIEILKEFHKRSKK